MPPPDDGGNGGGSPGPGEVTAAIVAPTISFGVAIADLPVAVRYTVTGEPEEIEGFYVPVADATPNSPAIGDRVIIATGLSAGANRFFNFQVDTAGFFRVGVIATTDSRQEVAESAAVIQVEGPPDPAFILPAEPLTVVSQGTGVEIRFDAGDPENRVQWRLFYLRETDPRNAAANALGVQLAVGSGNVGNFTWSTGSIPPGRYELGVSATDSGLSVAATVSAGQTDRIVTIPSGAQSGPIVRITEGDVSLPPVANFVTPGTDEIRLFRDEPLTVQLTVQVREPGATGLVEVFFDADREVANGFIDSIGTTNVPAGAVQTLSFPFPTNLAEGTYNLGVQVLDGVNEAVVEYAEGAVVVVREVTLEVLRPSTTLPVRPGDPVEVQWTTNAPPSVATVDVFARRFDPETGPFGDPIPILSDASAAVRTATWVPTSTGLFAVSVRVDITGGEFKQAEAPATVRVSTLPRILWLGSLAEQDPSFNGAILGGHNTEDNAGTSFAPAGDLDNDGQDDFVIAARYAKPFFSNPQGIGHGEAYLIFGASGEDRLRGVFNLNTVGGAALGGVVFAGIRTRQDSNQTDGLSSVSAVPDVDGDGLDELVFGFPDVASRGHNVSPQQDGVVDSFALSTLERSNQFRRGGIVIVSSQNSVLRGGATGGAMNLDLVGQDFLSTCGGPEPDDAPIEDDDRTVFIQNVHGDVDDEGEGCEGTCVAPESGGRVDGSSINFGFAAALARDFFSTYVYSSEFFGGAQFCEFAAQFQNHECLQLDPPVPHAYCGSAAPCEPFSPGLHFLAPEPDPLFPFPGRFNPNHPPRQSGFYVSFLDDPDNGVFPNLPLEPLGARIIGVGIGDDFGTSLAVLPDNNGRVGDLVVTSPSRTARGILLGAFPPGCENPPACGGEIDGLESSLGAPKVNSDSGVAYMFPLRSLWSGLPPAPMPPKPHQYIVGEASHSCGAQGLPLIDNVDALRIAGRSGENITNIIGLSDFNRDGRNDFAVGSPRASNGQGSVYVAYRREPAIEGDYVLEKLALDPSNPERLEGLLLTATSLDALGSSLATNFDFNGDEIPDLVIGSPNANAGSGEVIILFGGSGVRSGFGGKTVTSLLSDRLNGAPVAARIRGNPLDTQGGFGFNVANAGDIDGDGFDDLLVAAPGASPRFDPDPNDGEDRLTEFGLDLDQDGNQDEVPGENDLFQAGLVYVIYGDNRLDQITTCAASDRPCNSDADCAEGELCVADTDMTISVEQLGSRQLEGFMIAGRRAGDWLGGGDAGSVAQGGNSAKSGRGRSFGLSSAGDVDGDGRADILIGSILADPRRDPATGVGTRNGGEAYLFYGSAAP